jgi:hypothetical protein
MLNTILINCFMYYCLAKQTLAQEELKAECEQSIALLQQLQSTVLDVSLRFVEEVAVHLPPFSSTAEAATAAAAAAGTAAADIPREGIAASANFSIASFLNDFSHRIPDWQLRRMAAAAAEFEKGQAESTRKAMQTHRE